MEQMQKVSVFKNKDGHWYRNLEFDLVVYPTVDDEVKRFEFSIRHKGHSIQIHWENGHLDSYAIDQGETDPTKNMSPLLKKISHSLQKETFNKFLKVSEEIPEVWRNFVFTELRRIL